MAHFASPCQRSVLGRTDAAPMPLLVESTYMADYISPQLRLLRTLQAARPPASMTETCGRRVLQSATVQGGESLALQFIDDTPLWKRRNRAAAAVWWLRPLAERRKFNLTLEWRMRKGGVGSGKGAKQTAGGDKGAMEDADGDGGAEQLVGPAGPARSGGNASQDCCMPIEFGVPSLVPC